MFNISYRGYHELTAVDYKGSVQAHSDLHYGEEILLGGYSYYYKNKFNLSFLVGANYFISNFRGGEKVQSVAFRPEVYAGYNFSKGSIGFSMGNGCGSPNISVLSDIEQQIDDIQVKRGNSSFKTARFWNFSLYGNANVLKGTLYGGIHYLPIFNVMRNATLYENGKYVQTVATDGNHHVMRLGIGYVSGFSKHFILNTSGVSIIS